MKYRIVERKKKNGAVKYFVHEQEPESKEWFEILDENDDVVSFGELEKAKQFVEYLRGIDESLDEEEKVICEL